MVQELYKTRDLAEAAALIASGLRMIDMDKNGSVFFFVFSEREECEKLSNKFFFGQLMVDARIFYEATVRLKNKIFR